MLNLNVKKFLFFLLLGWVVISTAGAIDSFTISDIRVEGLQRVSPGTVFNYLPLKVGDQIDAVSAREGVKALHKTGFFREVQLKQEGTVLIVEVHERPSITQIDFVGNKIIDKDELVTNLRQAGFAEGRIYNKGLVESVKQELMQLYFAKGRYGTSVEITVTPQKRNRVAVTFDINEAAVARINEIKIIGNKVFSDDRLRDEFVLTTPGLFLFFSSRDDQYSKDKLEGDLESLKSFYLDRGYLDFKIESTQVSMSSDKTSIYLSIALSEGEQYSIKEVKIVGNLVFTRSELNKLITIQPGDQFSRKQLNDSRRAILDKLADEGYAFASVAALPNIDQQNHTVEFTLDIDPGRRVYVRRINISGNMATQDEVIRREMRLIEGGWFSAIKLRRSRVRLQRLDLFANVEIRTPAVPGSIDQVDVNVVVEEKSTGSFMGGAGYSTEDGLLLMAGVEFRNLFGEGKGLEIRIDNTSAREEYKIIYKDPYTTLSGVSRELYAESEKYSADEANTSSYLMNSARLGVNYQFPMTEFYSLQSGLSVEKLSLKSTDTTPSEYDAFINSNPEAWNYKITSGLTYDTRDSKTWAMSGGVRTASVEFTGPGSEIEYYRLFLKGSQYISLSDTISLHGRAELGYGDGYGELGQLPFYKNFFMGGPSTVRGYLSRSIGPYDDSADPKPIGGSKRIVGSLELLIPYPGSEKTRDKRFAFFVDGGQVYTPRDDIDLGEIRYSMGIGFNWLSAIGPIGLSYGVPINPQTGDQEERFQVSMGFIFN